MNDWERLLPYLHPYSRHLDSMQTLSTAAWLVLDEHGQAFELHTAEQAPLEAVFFLDKADNLSRWRYRPEQVMLEVEQQHSIQVYYLAFYDGELLVFRSLDRMHYLTLFRHEPVPEPAYEAVLQYLQATYRLPLNQPPYFGITSIAPTPAWQMADRPKTPAEEAAELQAQGEKRKKITDNLERVLVIRNVLVVAAFLAVIFWFLDRVPALFAIVTLVLALIHQLLVVGYQSDLKKFR